MVTILIVLVLLAVYAYFKLRRTKSEFVHYTHPDYSQQDLVAVRMAWSDQDVRHLIRKLLPRTLECDQVDYITQRGNIVFIKGGKVTTQISADKAVILSGEEFGKVIHNKVIIELANKRIKEQKKISHK